ncbi:hypothetical protein DFJ58DRAFT_761979, partial [Suillus subalutaceus]|uniref:uncharacterized protein n=1 Tax=Suillus subalutaceus TaxID=48586 RepID=UPI001B883569
MTLPHPTLPVLIFSPHLPVHILLIHIILHTLLTSHIFINSMLIQLSAHHLTLQRNIIIHPAVPLRHHQTWTD